MTIRHSNFAAIIAFVRSTIWWLLFAVSTVFYAILTILLIALPMRKRYHVVTTWSRLNIWTLRWLCGVSYQIEGRENIPDSAAIVMSKHQSTWETIAYSFIFPPQVWVLKKSLLRIPFFGWGLAMLNPIAIDRAAGSTAMEQVVTQGRERLKKGIWVVVFPEGTRVAYGKKRRYKMGGAVLAAETGFPVLPVAHNAGRLWARNQFIKWPGKITVCIGPLLHTQGLSADSINEQVEDWIEAQMERL